jgi:hypothetical protein
MGWFDTEDKIERDWFTDEIKSVGGKKTKTNIKGEVTEIGGEKVTRGYDGPQYVGKKKVSKDLIDGKTKIGNKKLDGNLD